ncbi:heme peroxidase [Dissophora globulifera]|uniref:Peroxidase n=1 Tax=Dissophora globulifera TaxID=979702 RepID=A0A9P6RKM1_9FUNG|nr:heme peroxidase [Dissophora globulifera]
MNLATRALFRASSLATAARRAPIVVSPRFAAIRTYASAQRQAGGGGGGMGSTLMVVAASAGAGAIGYHYYLEGTDPANVKQAAGAAAKGVAAAVSGEKDGKKEPIDYQKVYNHIATLLEDENYDDGSYGPVFLRLAWHASGTWDPAAKNGGSHGGTMRFKSESSDSANAGLGIARERLNRTKDKFPEISYGDLWTLAGVCAIQEMGGPTVKWRSGRVDGMEENAPPEGRLPDATRSDPKHYHDVFKRMGFNDQEIVALMGAHSLGRCHKDRSKFDGPWTDSPTVVTNAFYTELLNRHWVERKWDGPKQYEDKESKSLMMLPSDMAMLQDKEFKKWIEIYAKDEQKFTEDFAKAIAKLFELGCTFKENSKVYEFKATNA